MEVQDIVDAEREHLKNIKDVVPGKMKYSDKVVRNEKVLESFGDGRIL